MSFSIAFGRIRSSTNWRTVSWIVAVLVAEGEIHVPSLEGLEVS